MRLICKIISIMVCVLAFSISQAMGERKTETILVLHKREYKTESKLPHSAVIIEEEAFEGTALSCVIVPNNVLSIGERAFADISTLKEVIISNSTKNIASSAFEGSNRITISGPANSYARTWAWKHGLPYTTIIMFLVSAQGAESLSIFLISRNPEMTERKTEIYVPDNRWCSIEANNDLLVLSHMGNHIRGRSPPFRRT